MIGNILISLSSTIVHPHNWALLQYFRELKIMEQYLHAS